MTTAEPPPTGLAPGFVTDLAATVHAHLRERGATVATAESLTGGSIAAALTAVPGASATFLGGVVTYATELKQRLLGVPQPVIDTVGVISSDCAAAMAQGALAVTGATYALSSTGVAGPDRQEGHPPGTVYVGVAGPSRTVVLELDLTGDRAQIVQTTVAEALGALAQVIRGREETPLG